LVVANAEPAAPIVSEPVVVAEPAGLADEVEVIPEPVAIAATPAPEPARVVAAATPTPPRASAPAAAPTSSTAMDRLRASMADNPLLDAKTAEPAPAAAPTEPVKIPEGSAELWGEIETTEAPAGSPWTELK